MKYSIRFGYNSIASLTLKQKEFEVGSLFEINIPYCLWKKIDNFRSTSRKIYSYNALLARHTFYSILVTLFAVPLFLSSIFLLKAQAIIWIWNAFFLRGSYSICDVLRDLVPFLQFKKPGKYPWRSVTFSNTKSNTPSGVFFHVLKIV